MENVLDINHKKLDKWKNWGQLSVDWNKKDRSIYQGSGWDQGGGAYESVSAGARGFKIHTYWDWCQRIPQVIFN